MTPKQKQPEWIDNCSDCFKRRLVNIKNGRCYTCQSIYLEKRLNEVFKNDKSHTERMSQ